MSFVKPEIAQSSRPTRKTATLTSDEARSLARNSTEAFRAFFWPSASRPSKTRVTYRGALPSPAEAASTSLSAAMGRFTPFSVTSISSALRSLIGSPFLSWTTKIHAHGPHVLRAQLRRGEAGDQEQDGEEGGFHREPLPNI